MLKKPKPLFVKKKVVIISVENSDKTTDSVVTGNAIDILEKIGTLTIEVIKKLEKNMGKTFADRTLEGFICAIKEVNERR